MSFAATGKIGQQLVRILTEKGVATTAFVRDEAKAKASLPGAQFAKGDIEDLASFRKAIVGHDRLFLLTNRQDLEVGLAVAAQEAGVKQIVRISCWLAAAGHDNGSIFQVSIEKRFSKNDSGSKGAFFVIGTWIGRD